MQGSIALQILPLSHDVNRLAVIEEVIEFCKNSQ